VPAERRVTVRGVPRLSGATGSRQAGFSVRGAARLAEPFAVRLHARALLHGRPAPARRPLGRFLRCAPAHFDAVVGSYSTSNAVARASTSATVSRHALPSLRVYSMARSLTAPEVIRLSRPHASARFTTLARADVERLHAQHITGLLCGYYALVRYDALALGIPPVG
jgi:hypothetical protein